MKKTKSKKRIFISHAEKNQDFVYLMLNYLVHLGATRSTIFCSSDYRSGVQNKISDDVFNALRNTELDIIVLSNEYKKSEYCLNEAGVIRSKESKSVKIVVVFPDIQNGEYAGFINEDYWQYRFDAHYFIEALGKRLINELKSMQLINANKDQRELVYETFRKEILSYQRSMPTIENLTINWASGNEVIRARRDIKRAYENIRDLSIYEKSDNGPIDNIFYQQYERSVIIGQGKSPEKIKVKTITRYTIVNLSDKDIYQQFSAQFLKVDGGINTFSEDILMVNGEKNSDLIRTSNNDKPISSEDSPYVISKTMEVKTKAHSCDKLYFQNTYEIAPDLFFQSKVVRYPCGQYSLKVDFDNSFLQTVKRKRYIFRYQIIPPDPYNLENYLIPSYLGGGASDKTSVLALYNNGFPAGGGYVLTVSKIHSRKNKQKKGFFIKKTK